MKLQKMLLILPLATATLFAQANESTNASNTTTFQFSTEVSRTVEKDLMQATLYSRKSGKSLTELKKSVSGHLNKVVEMAKQYEDIEIKAEGISHRVNYNEKGKIDGWIAEGYVELSGKNVENIAKVLDNLGENVAISDIRFTVSKEKMKTLEDEMTLEVIKQFQHKAKVVQQGLNANRFTLIDVQLNTPNGRAEQYHPRAMTMAKMATYSDELPLEAGKETISATASGKVKFE